MNRYGLPEIDGALDDDDPQVNAFDRFVGLMVAPESTAKGVRRFNVRMRRARLAVLDLSIARAVSALSKAIRDGDAKAEAKAMRRLRRAVAS